MNDQTNQHTPSPEFRASLEREVVQAFRRQSQFSAPPSATRRARVRTAVTLAIGLFVGVGGAVATAQVQGSRVRDSLVLNSQLNRTMAMMKLELAQAELESVQKSVKAGARSAADLDAARINVMSAEFAIKRIDLETEETQLTGLLARDELWAPLVGQRDFVSQRLYFEAMISGQQLYRAEAMRQDALERARLGVIRASDTLEASGALQRVTAEARFLGQRRELRKSFLENKLNEAEISEKLQFYNMQLSMSTIMIKFRDAAERAKRARELQAAGVSTIVDVKRAELDSLESAQAVERLQLKLRASQLNQDANKLVEAMKKKAAEPPKKKP